MKLFKQLSTLLISLILLFTFGSCSKDNPDVTPGSLTLISVFSGNLPIQISGAVSQNIPLDQPIDLRFSVEVNSSTIAGAISWTGEDGPVNFSSSTLSNGKIIRLIPGSGLSNNTLYQIEISTSLKAQNGSSFAGTSIDYYTTAGPLILLEAKIDQQLMAENQYTNNVNFSPIIEFSFNTGLDTTIFKREVFFTGPESTKPKFSFFNDQKEVQLSFNQDLKPLSTYKLNLTDDIQGLGGEAFEEKEYSLSTKVDTTPKFPVISDEELLTKIQEYTFKYFWEFGHPVSGLARERNTSGQTVTTGGSGFGIMAMIVAVERNFISREEAIERWQTILDFLTNCDRFHGAWPHWLDGTSGNVRPFSAKDNGGDLVETAFLIQGLITLRQYLHPNNSTENSLIQKINTLWQEVEWDWYTKGENQALYWHWSPEFNWDINLKIAGHNETQIVYILAASSPTHTISKSIYESGYGKNGNIRNMNDYYGIELPIGPAFGGPLFFTHYSYLGLDPRNLVDQYANYWEQNTRHALINHAYCADNPFNYPGYSEDCWGLTASDGNNGYSAHSPTNDRGVITPTAAVASLPYTPEESMNAIRHFYYILGDRLWGEYGFYDAFNPGANWTASSYLAIDQGPIVCMIENYRSQLLWDLFMSAPEIQNGLDKLGFTY